jgi:hypothetical protein
MSSSAAVEGVAGGIGSLIALVVSYPLKTVRAVALSSRARAVECVAYTPTRMPPSAPSQIYTLQAIRAAESSKGRRLTLQERAALLSDPSRILAQLVPTLRGLFAGLCPAAVETTASSAVRVSAAVAQMMPVESAGRDRLTQMICMRGWSCVLLVLLLLALSLDAMAVDRQTLTIIPRA